MKPDNIKVLNELVNLYNTWDDEDDDDAAIGVSTPEEFFSACNYDDFPENFPVTQVEQEGGGEGNAESCMCVIQYKDKFYRFEYRYASYCGYDWDDATDTFKEVFPKEKMVKVYE